MTSAKTFAERARKLTGFLDKACPGIRVEAEHSARWDRPCLTFHWPGFAGTLLEERFHLLMRHIPEEFFESHCRGAVFLELAPGETVDEILAQPRSEDVADRVAEIWAMLNGRHFFACLEDELVRIPPAELQPDLRVSRKVLQALELDEDQQRDALLAFMHTGAYTDWEVLREIRPTAEGKAPDHDS